MDSRRSRLNVVILLFAVLAGGCGGRASAPDGVAAARAFYRAQPSYLSPIVLGDAVPAGLPDVRASTCGGCHQEIYAEWRISTHARAWMDDAQFQAELHKPREDGGDVQWMCVNCHTPMESQLPRLVTSLRGGRLDRPVYVDNPGFDPVLQAEAITCATCHVRDGVVLGPFGDTTAPHPTARSEHLLTTEVCTRCHQAEAEFPELVLACSFATGREYAASPQAGEGTTCQGCHMPPVERSLVAGGPVRATRRHWFGGSLIPKKPEFAAELEPLQAVYPDGLALAWEVVPTATEAGATAAVTLSFRNANAGHRLPTGDPERFLLVDLEARGPDGALLASATERIGTVYEWYPEIRKVSDNRLLPGEERRVSLTWTAPATGPVTVTGRASKWRLSQESLEYHGLSGTYPPGREFWSEVLAIPVGTVPTP